MKKSGFFFLAYLLYANHSFAQDVILKGTLSGKDHQTYHPLDFEVPNGTKRITVDFTYDGRTQKSTIDLGMIDPNGFRGWSGGNKSHFTIGENDATPSYGAGLIIPGKWQLLLGVPNMRHDAIANYTAKIYFEKEDNAGKMPFANNAINHNAKWYRGDLHMHTAHSDASCKSYNDKRVPCPVFLTAQAAVDNGLDFIAITDHNSISQFNSMRELQPYFDNLLMMPGQEVTTFYGHFNVFPTTNFIPFQIRTKDIPSVNNIIDKSHEYGAIFSINHPMVPSGEVCMGCGFSASNADFSKIDTIEVANGGTIENTGAIESTMEGVDFWQQKLNQGYHITAISGSDNHDPLRKIAKIPTVLYGVGYPADVVYAAELSQPAIIQGIKSGRVFIDFMPKPDKAPHILEISANSGKENAIMGQTLKVKKNDKVTINVNISGCDECNIEFIENGEIINFPKGNNNNQYIIPKVDFGANNKAWVRVNARDKQGKLMMLANPIYFIKQ